MLWRTLLCCLVLAGAVSATIWDPEFLYEYGIYMRTVTSPSAGVAAGSQMKMKMKIRAFNSTALSVLFTGVEDAPFLTEHIPNSWAFQTPPKDAPFITEHIPNSWAFQTPPKGPSWQSVPIFDEPILVLMHENGTVKDMHVEAETEYWQYKFMRDMFKQVDLHISSKLRNREASMSHTSGQDNKYFTFDRIEMSELGKCNARYHVHPLTPVEQQYSQYPIHKVSDRHLVVRKTTNCSEMKQFTIKPSDPQTVDAGGNAASPVSCITESSFLIEGNPEDFTILQVETNSTLSVSPLLYTKQKFMVEINFKANLMSKTETSSPIPKPQNPQNIENAIREQRQIGADFVPYMKQVSSEVFFPPSGASQRSYMRDQSNEWSSYVPELPYHIANNGKRIGDGLGRNITDVIVQLVSDISANLHIDEGVSTPWILSNLIVSIKHMRTMTVEEIITTHNILVQNENSNPAEFRLAGKVFRNIAALTGTPHSLQALLLWLQKEEISVQEFTQHISMQREAAFIPDYYYLETLWKIAIEVDKIQHSDEQALHNLRATVALTFTDILRMAGRRHKQLTKTVVHYYITRMEEAIKTNNNKQMQLMMRIVGNIASKDMLEPFYKIINGEWGWTESLRLHALLCLDWLTAVHPKAMTKFWVSILGNTTLPHRLRCQAVPNIMRSNPPAWILQQMAQATHNETNPHVIAQVASAIRTAAQLRGPFNEELARNARGALTLLKPEVFDASYSSVLFDSYKIEGMDLSYTQLLNYIGSQDSLIPSAFQYFVNKNYNGYRPLDFQASGMVSSVNDTLEAILNTLFKPQALFSTEHIPTARFPGIHVQRRPKLEGNLNVPGYGFWYFDEKNLQKTIAELIVNPDTSSIPVETMKMSNGREIIFAVPSGLGHTFVYTYTSVQLTNIKGNVWLKKHFDIVKSYGKSRGSKSQSLSANVKLGGNLDITLATREESKLGFVTPWNSLDYISGLNINTQVHAPIDTSIGVEYNSEWNDVQVSAEVSLPETKSVNIFHHSTEPYVSKIWLLGDTTTTTGNPNTTVLHVETPITASTWWGKGSTGMAMRLDYSSETDATNEDIPWNSWWSTAYKGWKGYNIWSLIHFAWAKRSIHSSSLNVTYDPWEATTNTARLNWRFGVSGFPTLTEVIGALKPQKPKYHPRSLGVPFAAEVPPQQQFSGGLSQRQVLWNVTFEGKAVAAFGLYGTLQSNVMNQSFSSSVQLWSKPVTKEQFNAALELSWQVPRVSLWNFQQALSTSPNSTVEALLTVARPSWAKSAVVMFTGKLGRTPQRQEYISESPIAQACLKEMQSGHNILRACQNATIWANSLDAFEFSIRYKHIPVELKRVALATYSTVRQAAYSQLQEEVFLVNPYTNTISVGWYINNQSTALNFSLQSNLVNANVTNFPIPSWAQPIIPNAGRSLVNRIGQHFYPLSYAPSFVLDHDHVITLDGRSYLWRASDCWYIALARTPKWQANAPIGQDQVYQPKDQKQRVQVRQTKEGYLESEIWYDDLLVKIWGLHDNITVSVNGKVMENNYFSIPGIVSISIPVYGAVDLVIDSFIDEMHQDPYSLMIRPNSNLKDSISGMAGTWNGEPQDDFLSPTGCVMDDDFANQWTDCKRPSKQSTCVSIHNTVNPHQPVSGSQGTSSVYAPLQTNIFEYFDFSSENSESQEQTTETGYDGSTAFLQGLHSTVIYQNDIQVINKRICFSINPIVKCKANQKPLSTQPNIVSYHCMSEGPEANKIKQQIERFIVPRELQSKPVSIRMPSIQPQECSGY